MGNFRFRLEAAPMKPVPELTQIPPSPCALTSGGAHHIRVSLQLTPHLL